MTGPSGGDNKEQAVAETNTNTADRINRPVKRKSTSISQKDATNLVVLLHEAILQGAVTRTGLLLIVEEIPCQTGLSL